MKKTTMLDDVKALNPSGDRNNCTVCSMAYDLRKRGFDVAAAPATEIGLNYHDIQKCYKRADNFYTVFLSGDVRGKEAFQRLENEISKNPEGSRGILLGGYAERFGGGGHAIAWEVKSGKTLFIDGQIGSVFNNPYEALFRFFDENQIVYARLDDKELNPKRLSGFRSSIHSMVDRGRDKRYANGKINKGARAL